MLLTHRIVFLLNKMLNFYKKQQNRRESNLNFFYLGFFKVPHIWPRLMEHKRCINSIWLRKPNLIWRNVGIVSRLRSGLCDIRRVVHFQNLLLLSDAFFLFVTLLVTYHLQVFNFGFRCWWKTLLHTFFGLVEICLQFISFALVLNVIGLAHGEFWYCGFHLTS